MDNEIKVFNHELFGQIRTMTNEEGETFFVGKDVAKALGYSNTRKALVDHVDLEDKTDGVTIRDAIGRNQTMVIINESGLYSLILSSKLRSAKEFKRWVTSEVLPQIRKTGGYIPTHDAQGRELTPEEIVKAANMILGRTLRMLNAPNINCLTATEVAKSWGMNVTEFNQLLCELGIQYKRGGRYSLNKDYEALGLTEDRVFMSYSLMGKPKVRTYLTWTPQGVNFLNKTAKTLAPPSKPRGIQLQIIFNL